MSLQLRPEHIDPNTGRMSDAFLFTEETLREDQAETHERIELEQRASRMRAVAWLQEAERGVDECTAWVTREIADHGQGRLTAGATIVQEHRGALLEARAGLPPHPTNVQNRMSPTTVVVSPNGKLQEVPRPRSGADAMVEPKLVELPRATRHDGVAGSQQLVDEAAAREAVLAELTAIKLAEMRAEKE